MKLHITKDQSKGMLGGVSFQLEAKVELTQKEAELVKKYKADKESLIQKEITVFGKTLAFDLKIENLVRGETFRCRDISDILETEASVKEACARFKSYIEAMGSFGGRETSEYS